MSILDQFNKTFIANISVAVSIGPGTGKTWHLIDAACTRAMQGERVLMLSAELWEIDAIDRIDQLGYPESVLDDIVYIEYASNNVGPDLGQYLDDLIESNNITCVVLDVYQDKFSIIEHLHKKIPMVVGSI